MKSYIPENWETSKKRLTLLWDNEILDRPCVSVSAPKDPNNKHRGTRPWGTETIKEYYLNPECILERNLDKFEKTYLAGDAFPVIFPYWACGGHFKYLMTQEMFDSKVFYEKRTIWAEPMIEDYEEFDFNFDKSNPIFRAELEALRYLAEEGKGKFFVAMPDNCGSYDGLAAMRGNEEILMDMIAEPEAVKMAGNKLVDALIASGDEMMDVLWENNDNGSAHGWYGTWCPGKHMQMQCDLSVMISPEMFEEYIVEELERTTNWLDRAIYHMDGIEQTRFLDMILNIKRVSMIQWVQCAGQPDVTHNYHHVRRIQEAGKGLHLTIRKDQLDSVLNNTRAEGRMLVVSGAANPQEADEIVNYIANHSFRKTLY